MHYRSMNHIRESAFQITKKLDLCCSKMLCTLICNKGSLVVTSCLTRVHEAKIKRSVETRSFSNTCLFLDFVMHRNIFIVVKKDFQPKRWSLIISEVWVLENFETRDEVVFPFFPSVGIIVILLAGRELCSTFWYRQVNPATCEQVAIFLKANAWRKNLFLNFVAFEAYFSAADKFTSEK